MKKKFLFIIMCLLFITNVNAKTYTNYNIGDIVTLSKGNDTTSEWIVIENSDPTKDTIKLLKASAATSEAIQYNPIWKRNNTYAGSNIEKEVNKYKNILGINEYLTEIRLPSKDDLKLLGCASNCKDEGASSWLYNVGYWLSNIKDSNMVYRVSSSGKIAVESVDNYFHLRPVIVVSKDAIKDGYKNDERTFDNIDITCDKELKSGQEFECIIKIDKLVQSMNFDLKIEGLSILDEYVFENATWNEDLEILGEYEKEGISLTKLSGQEESDILLKLSGISKELKEDSKIKFTFKNVKLYDEVLDYQNIDSIEKELTFLKEEKQELIENPKTGIGSIILILTILSIFGGLTYFVVNKYSNKNTL